MNWLLGSLGVLWGGALCCLLARRFPAGVRVLGPAVTVVGSLLGGMSVVSAWSGASEPVWHVAWPLPLGAFSIAMDPLSAVFAAPILLVSALAAVYGAGYLRPHEGARSTGTSWFFYNVLVGSMLLVVAARNVVLFLLAWEIMSLASFFLVMFENEREGVRRAGWTYLVATHIGTAFLLALFVLLEGKGGTLDFADFAVPATPVAAGVAFVLALIGFGTKAGFVPLHVWLPEAHPAAPSHVSAVMSGVMIKTGIYGLLRVFTYLGTPPSWWGWTLVVVGAVSGVLGVLFALAQHDFKRLLAYHSVENIGIIALGLGVGMLGVHYGHPVVAALGFAGGLLHVVNHALFKSLLFMSAGSVLHVAGTCEIDRLGGLLKRLPVTGLAFLVGSVAICGLPPLNGFVSEFVIYLAALKGMEGGQALPASAWAAGFVVCGALALIGGLAVACFTKVFGVIFLGEPRSAHAAGAHEAGLAMRLPMMILAFACFAVGLTGPLALRALRPAVQVLAAFDPSGAEALSPSGWGMGTLWMVTAASAGLCAVAGLLALVRAAVLSGRPRGQAVTWDCGYARPTARMQYTASSFAQPITGFFNRFLATHRVFTPPEGLFPGGSSFSSETPDMYRERMYQPAFAVTERLMSRFRGLQHGRVNLYILCMVVALLVLLAWKLR